MSDSMGFTDAGVLAELERLKRQINNKGPVLEAIGAEFVKRIQLNFRNSQTPEGVPWAPLKKRKGQPLQDTRRLMNSISYQTHGDSVSVGTNVVYAPVHNFGHTFSRAPRTHTLYFKQDKSGNISQTFVKAHHSNFAQTVKVGAHSITIPARKFMPSDNLPPSWQNAIGKIVERHLKQ